MYIMMLIMVVHGIFIFDYVEFENCDRDMDYVGDRVF